MIIHKLNSLVLLVLCLLMTFCSPKKVDIEKKEQEFLIHTMPEWSLRPTGVLANKIIFCDGEDVYSHDLITDADTLLINNASGTKAKLLESSDSSFVYSLLLDNNTHIKSVYKYDIYSKKEIDLWKEICGDKEYHQFDAYDHFFLYVDIKDPESTYGPGNGEIPIASNEDLILYDYHTKQKQIINIITKDGSVLKRKKLPSNQARLNAYYTKYHMLLERWCGGNIVELYHYAPQLGDTEIKYVTKGEQLDFGFDDDEYTQVYYVVKTDHESYARYDYRGRVVKEFPTATGYVAREKIPKNDIVAVFSECVFFFKTTSGRLADYTGLFRYDVKEQTLSEIDSFNIDGQRVPIVINSARLSKDKESIIINCSSTAESFLVSYALWGTNLIARGKSVLTTDYFYQVDGRNGSTQYFDLNGREITVNQAGAAALGLSDSWLW